uniref:Uncharacterized protein n=1 Tax=Lepeophtheirus salmonis TaxID=72036 RepID=A0A0K2TS41_LEPSM
MFRFGGKETRHNISKDLRFRKSYLLPNQKQINYVSGRVSTLTMEGL